MAIEGAVKFRLRARWSCSDFVKHEHRWVWTARWCGRIQRIWRNAAQALCAHEFYFEDLKRWNDDLVTGRCHKCAKVCEADCGLHLAGKLMGYRPALRRSTEHE